MWRWYTAEDRRQAAAVLLLIATLGAAVIASLPVLAGLLLITASGGSTRALEAARWPHVAVELWANPDAPGAAFGVARLSPGVFWPVAVLLLAAGGVAYGWFAVTGWRVLGPTGIGFASRSDVAAELSLRICRGRAKITRPDLERRGRATASPAQVAIPLHVSPVSRTRLWLPLENATGVIAPQQSGKTLMDLIHKALAAPGGLIVTSTKLDLFLLTARARERGGSPVQVLDLTGAVRWPHRVRWNPVRGCTTVKAAKRRAQALLRATTGDATDATGNHAFFERRAVDVLTAYLLAAALSRATIDEFVGWCQNELDTEAVAVLREHSEFAAVRRSLQQAQSVVEETRSGIWETLRDAVACLTDPDVVGSSLPRAEEQAFDPEAFVRGAGTVYVIGSEDDAAAQAPLITAFVQEVLDTARRLALTDSRNAGRERLAPPFTAVLDEIASISPLPDLPDTVSDSAGRGVLIHYALQSPAQAQARWGKRAATLFDNTTALTVFGGLKSEDTLKWASLLAGRRLEERRSRQTGRGFTDIGSMHIGSERTDTLEPAAVRQIPRGRALLIMRSMPALMVHLQPAWKRKDWKQLAADAESLRKETQVAAGVALGKPLSTPTTAAVAR